ncbi:Ferritin heavy chain [Manis javanica]|nr:ferritin heavy chain-like [Manis javanica]KAI5939391.1 Ferritin heavy chain [Manis javanica]
MNGEQPTLVVQNYPLDCQAAVNKQINMELTASYTYLSMAFYFNRNDVALKHFGQFFLHQSRGKSERAEKLMHLQNERDGRLSLCDIRNPGRDDWGNGVTAMEYALGLEKRVNQSLLDLHRLATNKGDAHLCDFLECHYLHRQVRSIKELGDRISILCKTGAPQAGQAEYLFDKLTLGNSDKN